MGIKKVVYTMNDVERFLYTINKNTLVSSKGKYFYNLPMSFDIETSSFYSVDGVQIDNETQRKYQYKNAVKKAIMYIWQFAIGDNVIYGRNWDEYVDFTSRLYEYLELKNNRYIIIYVHNLSYEFQFIKDWFKWIDIFADDTHKPIKASSLNNFVYKCSYRLSGYSLETIAKNLHKHTIKKLVGELDYDKIRTPKTPLNSRELQYCFNDVFIVNSYISELLDEYKTLERIPLTQTGKIRRLTRKKCIEKNGAYVNFMKKMTLDKIEYIMLKKAFAGGFTHANAMYVNQVLKDVTSYDFTSSYPTVMLSEKYPMSKGVAMENLTIDDVKKLSLAHCLLIDVYIEGLKPRFKYENILSYSKCREVKNPLINNGRIVSADSLRTTLTEVDLWCVDRFYFYDKIIIGLCYVYKKDYLPKPIIDTILDLYKQKTELKGVEGREIEYLHSKELLNSVYGMCVTSILHDVITYADKKWTVTPPNIDVEIEKYNTDRNRFLFYPWGVWVTAYARKNLYTGIIECAEDYIYADTDSIKIFNADKHKKYFELYNKNITEKIRLCLENYKIDVSYAMPKTIDNIYKPLGVWDFDGHYERFKTLGAKRYMTESCSNYSITVAGLSKKTGIEYIKNRDIPFNYFNNGMYIDCDHTGKMTHTYIDNNIDLEVTDYMGGVCRCIEKSYIHLEKTDYMLSMSKMYLEYLGGLKTLI